MAGRAAPKEIVVNDKMQQGYRYVLTEPEGEDFAAEFKPELTPKEMLALGVFGGKYMTDCRDEFPAAWYENAKLSPERNDPSLNFFGDQRLAAAGGVAEAGLDLRRRPAGLVPVVLPLLLGAAGSRTKTRGRSDAGRR